jgi:hypothetical protein
MEATANRIRAGFAEVARGLMEWEEPPRVMQREQVPAYTPRPGTLTDLERSVPNPNGGMRYTPRGKQETPQYVEPFDVQADWDEHT